jgi:RNA polymerase sigma factor for flagellar operon FliA
MRTGSIIGRVPPATTTRHAADVHDIHDVAEHAADGAHDRLWRAHAEGDLAARDALLAEHLSLVHHVARRLARTLAGRADLDELVSAGTVGLIDAVDGFDWRRGRAFSTFAVPRIRGAILDELRRLDHVPRSIRRKTRELGTAREALTLALGRLPDARELAARIGEDVETVWRWQAETEGAVHLPLDGGAGDREDGAAPLAHTIGDADVESIEERLTTEREAVILRGAILRLREQERVVLTLYYFEELKLHQIGAILGITESRVSQVRSRALAKLRDVMAPLRRDVA